MPPVIDRQEQARATRQAPSQIATYTMKPIDTAWAAPKVSRAPAAASEKSRSRLPGTSKEWMSCTQVNRPASGDLDRAQLADLGRPEDLEDEGGEDPEHGDGEDDLHPLPGSARVR